MRYPIPKSTIACGLFLIGWLFANATFAQKIPQHPNQTDAQGRKQGTWTILYDKNWKVIKNPKKAEFYRVISYQNGKPVGKVVDYYKNGKPQMVADSLISEEPEKLQGKALFYHENGKVHNEKYYNKGVLVRKVVYNLNGSVAEKPFMHFSHTGNEFYKRGEYKKALSFWLLAKEQARKEFGKYHIAHLNAFNHIANIYRLLGDYKRSEAYFLRLLKMSKKTKNAQFLSYYNDLAVFYQIIGEFDKAREAYSQMKVLGQSKFRVQPDIYATYLNNLGGFYKLTGNYKKAEEHYLKGLDYSRKIKKPNRNYATSLHNLAVLYSKLGDYKKAENAYLEAIKLREKTLGKQHPRYASSLSALAFLYVEQSQYTKAEKLHQKALKIMLNSRGKNSSVHIDCLNNLGHLYLAKRNYKKAEQFLLKAMKIISRRKNRKGTLLYFAVSHNLILYYFRKKEYQQAEKLISTILDRKKQLLGVNHTSYAITLNLLAAIQHFQGINGMAESNYKEAINIVERSMSSNHFDYLMYNMNLAALYDAQKLYRKAEPLYSNVVMRLPKYVKDNLFEVNASGRKSFLRYKIIAAYNIYYSFICKYIQFFSSSNNSKVLSQLYDSHLFIKSFLFNSTQKTKERIFNSGDTALIQQYEHFIAKRVRYNKLLQRTKAQRKKQGLSMEKLADEIDQLEKGLAQKSWDFAQDLEEYTPHTWQEIQQILKPGEASIELIRFRHFSGRNWTDTVYYAALIVTPENKYIEPVFLTDGNFLEGKGYQYYLKNIGAKSQDVQSYQQFWQPIQQRLQKIYPQAKKLFVSLDGVYHRLNLETLWNPTTKQYLGEMIDIQIVSNTKDLLKRSPRQDQVKMTHQRAVLFGYPDYKQFNPQPLSAGNTQTPERYGTYLNTREKRALGDGFDGKNIPNLPHTKTEVQNVQKLLSKTLSSTAYLGKDATEENLKAVRNPAILHLATHGFFLEDDDLDRLRKKDQFRLGSLELKQYDANPLMRSGLVWTGAEATFKALPRPQNVQEDGVLTAQEVLNMTLDSTDLVVLSACETGKGKIESGQRVYGLQRAFLSAGAKNVLMSLWKVDDEATQWFMRYFYQDLIHHQNIRRAYRTAQQRLRKKYPAPYHWGAFVLVSR